MPIYGSNQYWWLQAYRHWDTLLQQHSRYHPLVKWNHYWTTSSRILYELIDVYFLCNGCWNFPCTHVYNVAPFQHHLHMEYIYSSQLIRYSRACSSCQDCLHRGLLLTRKLLNQAFLLVKLKSSCRKVYGHSHELVGLYGISVSQMTTDMFHFL